MSVAIQAFASVPQIKVNAIDTDRTIRKRLAFL